MELRITRLIAAPPQAVFRLYVDPDKLGLWQPGVRGVREATGPLDQVGSSYVLDQSGPPLRMTVQAAEPPRLHQQLESVGWYAWVGTARFEAADGGRTRFSYTYRPHGRFGWLSFPLVALGAAIIGRTEFSRLRELAESDWAGRDQV